MVKSKKMSKTSIAVIVLALLLVLSLCLGITGAWFTSYDKKSTQDITFKFGQVTVGLAVDTKVSNDEDGDDEYFEAANANANPAQLSEENNIEYETVDGKRVYKLIAGSRIKTGIDLTNTSTVDIYYVLYSAKLQAYYVIDAENGKLLPVSSGADLDKLAMGQERHFVRLYQVVEVANGDDSELHNVENTAKNAIFKVWNGTLPGGKTIDNVPHDAEGWAAVSAADGYYAYANDTLTYNTNVSLGALLISGEFQLRAVQADNMTATQAHEYLTANANWAETNGD